MSLMGESGCNQVLSVDGCDQNKGWRRSWTFRRSGVLCAKDATPVGRGGGRHSPRGAEEGTDRQAR